MDRWADGWTDGWMDRRVGAASVQEEMGKERVVLCKVKAYHNCTYHTIQYTCQIYTYSNSNKPKIAVFLQGKEDRFSIHHFSAHGALGAIGMLRSPSLPHILLPTRLQLRSVLHALDHPAPESCELRRLPRRI